MLFVCKSDMCTGCTACVSICSKNAIIIKKTVATYNAEIDKDKCVNCNACRNICPQNNKVSLRDPALWKQGWAEDEDIRSRAASGGCATAIASAFIQNGGVVCSCTFRGGEFRFDFATNVNDVYKFSGSKYIKSDPAGVFVKVREFLQHGQKALFIGLPCQIAGLLSYIPQKLQSNLYTIDLICHGTPSIELLKKYLEEHGVNIDEIESISFREKHSFGIKDFGIALSPAGISDRYIISFLKCLNFTPNCYACNYATIKRVSDITLGDSWGSTLSTEEQDKGISLLLCQTEKGKDLLDMASLHLVDVDIQRAVANNRQLYAPASNPHRNRFMKLISRGRKYDRAMFEIYPKLFIKQDIKAFLLKLKLISGGGED